MSTIRMRMVRRCRWPEIVRVRAVSHEATSSTVLCVIMYDEKSRVDIKGLFHTLQPQINKR